MQRVIHVQICSFSFKIIFRILKKKIDLTGTRPGRAMKKSAIRSNIQVESNADKTEYPDSIQGSICIPYRKRNVKSIILRNSRINIRKFSHQIFIICFHFIFKHNIHLISNTNHIAFKFEKQVLKYT